LIQDLSLGGPLRILAEKTEAKGVVSLGVWFDRGSRDEGEPLIGATHFIEHMLFKGTPTRSAATAARQIDALGGVINAFTERECMALYCTVPSESFSQAMEILSDLVNHSLFDPQEFERERAVIENEIESADDDPEEVAYDVFFRRLWGTHPLGRKIGGTVAEVRTLSRSSVVDFYNSAFLSHVSVISVAGDVDFDEVVDACAPFTVGRATSPEPQNREGPLLSQSSFSFYEVISAQSLQFFYGYPRIGRFNEDDYYTLEVANVAIGDSMGSRLFQELREQRGLCYSVYSSPVLFSDASLWFVYASASVPKGSELVQRIHESLGVLKQRGLEEKELETAKAHLRGMIRIASQDTEYRMRRLARQALSRGPLLSREEAINKVNRVTLDQVRQTMEWFFAQPPVLFAAGPRSGKQALTKTFNHVTP